MQDFLTCLGEIHLIEIEVRRLVEPTVDTETYEPCEYGKEQNKNQDNVGYFDLRERNGERTGPDLDTVGHSQVTPAGWARLEIR